MADTHPGTHEAGGSSFTGNTLGNKGGCEREQKIFCPPSRAEQPSHQRLSSDCPLWRLHRAPGILLPLLPGHQTRSSHLSGLQVQRAPYSPGHLVFHLHLGDQEGQEVPRRQSGMH